MKIIWLSHVLNSDAPLYGGEKDIEINRRLSLEKGDSCNTLSLTLSTHAGSHVDVPYHFSLQGRTIDQYSAETWIFRSPEIITVVTQPTQLILPNHILRRPGPDLNADLVLIRTGFEQYRGADAYWKDSPGISEEFARYLLDQFPSLRALGIDCISISSLWHRDEGRSVHRILLGENILLFEDLSLSGIDADERLNQVLALPIRIKHGDGAPCTVIGFIE